MDGLGAETGDFDFQRYAGPPPPIRLANIIQFRRKAVAALANGVNDTVVGDIRNNKAAHLEGQAALARALVAQIALPRRAWCATPGVPMRSRPTGSTDPRWFRSLLTGGDQARMDRRIYARYRSRASRGAEARFSPGRDRQLPKL
jgi:hypothetical protein